MSGKQAKRARKAARPEGEPDYKDPKRPTRPYVSKRDRQAGQAALNRALREMEAEVVRGVAKGAQS